MFGAWVFLRILGSSSYYASAEQGVYYTSAFAIEPRELEVKPYFRTVLKLRLIPPVACSARACPPGDFYDNVRAFDAFAARWMGA